MGKRRKPYWSMREEEFLNAVKIWLRKSNKDFDEEEDIVGLTEPLSFEEQRELAKWLGMTPAELKGCIAVNSVVYPNRDQQKRWTWYEDPPEPLILRDVPVRYG